MKTIALIGDFENVTEKKKNKIAQIKEKSGADCVIAVMSGNYLRSGLPAKTNKHVRAAKAVEAGVDIVIERPVFTAVTGLDTFAPSGIALLDKLRVVDYLCVPTTITDEKLAEKITFFLFAETRELQNELKKYKAKGCSHYEAQAIVIDKAFPGTLEEMNKEINYTAFEYLKGIKRMYSPMKPVLFGEDFYEESDNEQVDEEKAKKLFKLMRYQMLLVREKMSQIYGGSTMLSETLLSNVEKISDYKEFISACESADHPADNINQFLNHLLLGIGKSDIAMSRMYDSAPYARILARSDKSDELMAVIRSKGRIPVVEDIKKDYVSMDSTSRGLLDIDIRASKIYKLDL